MDTYSFMRQFADSWGLLFLFSTFIGSILWAFRPRSRKDHADTANIVFRNDTAADAPDQEAGK